MLIPPPIPAPDTLKGVDDLIRSGFEQFSELWFRRLLEATALVAIGLLFELLEIWHESVEAIKELLDCGPEKRIKPWAKLFGTLGWILIVGGVCGEFWAESVTSKADGFIRKFDEILLAEANRNAGAAADSAKTARNEADAAVKSASDARTIANGARLESHAAAKLAGKAGDKADEISARLDTAGQQLSQVERRVRIQGPRGKLLMDGQKTFVEALKPFKGQKVIMVTCAPRQAPWQHQEEYIFENILLNLLLEPRPGSRQGAGWMVLTGSSYSCAGWGRGVWRHSSHLEWRKQLSQLHQNRFPTCSSI